MEAFTPLPSLLGGALIGLSAALVLLALGRVAGVSGIFGGLLAPKRGDLGWRLAFALGLMFGGALVSRVMPSLLAVNIDRSLETLAVAGLLAGFGARMSNGCTSGHGVCGLARFSRRSLVAVTTFITTGALTVFVVLHLCGGSR
jgi:uncharacterized membrane protein YedE/YeeE